MSVLTVFGLLVSAKGHRFDSCLAHFRKISRINHFVGPPSWAPLYESGTYRAVYTAKLAGAIYVLHVFQKKATRGIATPKHAIDLIKARLRRAEEHAQSAAGGA